MHFVYARCRADVSRRSDSRLLSFFYSSALTPIYKWPRASGRARVKRHVKRRETESGAPTATDGAGRAMSSDARAFEFQIRVGATRAARSRDAILLSSGPFLAESTGQHFAAVQPDRSSPGRHLISVDEKTKFRGSRSQ